MCIYIIYTNGLQYPKLEREREREIERERERERGRDRETVRNIDSTVLNLGKQGSAICTPGLSTIDILTIY